MPVKFAAAAFALFLSACTTPPRETSLALREAQVDAIGKDAMAATGAKGLAIAVIDSGVLVTARAYGVRNALPQKGMSRPWIG